MCFNRPLAKSPSTTETVWVSTHRLMKFQSPAREKPFYNTETLGRSLVHDVFQSPAREKPFYNNSNVLGASTLTDVSIARSRKALLQRNISQYYSGSYTGFNRPLAKSPSTNWSKYGTTRERRRVSIARSRKALLQHHNRVLIGKHYAKFQSPAREKPFYNLMVEMARLGSRQGFNRPLAKSPSTTEC